jgi:hypothetical protein
MVNLRRQPLAHSARTTLVLSLCLAMAPWFFGCDSAVIVRQYDDSGQLLEEQACLKIVSDRDGKETLVPHGLHVVWDADGNRRKLEVFNRGKRVGYVLSWDPQGRLLREGVGFQEAFASNPVATSNSPISQ